MKLPSIAPLTRQEARAARGALTYMRGSAERMTAGSEHQALAAAVVRELDASLEEYEQRTWWRRWAAGDAGHKTRLRPWMLEVKGELDRRLASDRVSE